MSYEFHILALLIIVLNASTIFTKEMGIERVIVIGIDGAGSFHNPDLSPHIAFLESGTYCNYARAVYPTNSGENWGSILTGVTPDKHGVTNLNINQSYSENSQFPTIFQIITKSSPPTTNLASLVSWGPINDGCIEPSLPVFKYVELDALLVPYITKSFLPLNGRDTKFLFIQLSDVDYAGHKHGWESEEYLEQFRKTDRHFKEILDAIDGNGLGSSTLVFLTADHGGLNQTHGGDSEAESHVLWGVRGPDVVRQELPPDSVTSMDIPAIVLSVLGIEVPSHFDGRIIPIFNNYL